MVDKENLGDNNMSSEQVGGTSQGTQVPGTITCCLLSNSGLSQAKRYSQRKTSLHCSGQATQRKKKARASYPGAPGFRVHSQM